MFERLERGSTLGWLVRECLSVRAGTQEGVGSKMQLRGRGLQAKGTASTKALRQEGVPMLKAQKEVSFPG